MSQLECQNCKSQRVIGIEALAKDQFLVRMPGETWEATYAEGSNDSAPFGVGLDSPDSNGDSITFDFCLNCGQMQGEWPAPKSYYEMNREEQILSEYLPEYHASIRVQLIAQGFTNADGTADIVTWADKYGYTEDTKAE